MPPPPHLHTFFARARPQLINLGVSLVVTKLYYASKADENTAMDEGLAWAFIGSMSGAWLAIFGVYLASINAKYRRTFWDRQTGREWICSYFTKEGASDASKMQIHASRRLLWTSMRPQVKEWTLENWARFELEKPEWFSPGLIAQVEDEMIPKTALAMLKAEGNGERRKSSLYDQLLGDGLKSSAKVVPAEWGEEE